MKATKKRVTEEKEEEVWGGSFTSFLTSGVDIFLGWLDNFHRIFTDGLPQQMTGWSRR